MSVGGGPAPAVIQWLDQVLASLACYRNPDIPRIRRDVIEALRQYPGLNVCQDTPQRAPPAPRALPQLRLWGTVPTFYRGVQYNTPVTVWIVEQYPLYPPQVLVTPTDDMVVKDGHPFVNALGVVFSDYLAQWNSQRSTLIGLLQDMCQRFGQNPPLRSVVRPPAQGVQGAPPQSRPVSMVSQQSQPPSQPQSAGGIGGMASAVLAFASQKLGISGNASAAASGNPSPHASVGYPGTNASPVGGYGQPPQPVQHQQPPPPPPPPPPAQPRMPSESEQIQETIAVLTARLQKDVAVLRSQQQATVDRLLQVQSNLMANSQRVRQLKSTLEAEVHALQTNRDVLVSHIAELERFLQANESATEFDVDAAIQPASAREQQLLESLAKDMAYEDAFAALQRALEYGYITLEVFIQRCRMLSQDQFDAKTMVRRIMLAAPPSGGAIATR